MEATCYSVELVKGAYGLGIYFAAASDASHAIVDTRVPFYRLPSGAVGPGEASGAILAGDLLLAVNDIDVSTLRFPQIVEQLRQVPRGPVTLVFQRQRRLERRIKRKAIRSRRKRRRSDPKGGQCFSDSEQVLRHQM
ncbi:hypothetical protein DVH05_003126 [Phytophthora capsici]|nr:hypothetical protein DVH05_003126 [Phytophthora capsici]|eukprot:jgi/Phyca11/509116/fgenesh2_kg.PHYCAscaffold_42_\